MSRLDRLPSLMTSPELLLEPKVTERLSIPPTLAATVPVIEKLPPFADWYSKFRSVASKATPSTPKVESMVMSRLVSVPCWITSPRTRRWGRCQGGWRRGCRR